MTLLDAKNQYQKRHTCAWHIDQLLRTGLNPGYNLHKWDAQFCEPKPANPTPSDLIALAISTSL
jgi:hypothetical protein